LYISFFRYHLLFPGKAFNGFTNYFNVLTDPVFLASLWRTLYFVVVSISLEMFLGLSVALVLNEEFKGRGIVRALIIIPWAIPTIVNGVLWRWIYQPNFGALNGLLYQFGLIDSYKNWLARPFLAMNMTILADAWHMTPFYVLLILAGLQGISPTLYEAGRVDGASWFRQLRHITLPLLKPTFLVILVIRTIETFRVFDIIYALTGGGPGDGTKVVGYYAYEQTFRFLDFGTGSAVSILITAAVLLLAIMYIRLLNVDE
jgi:ABC-type sugar transport system permease subunit